MASQNERGEPELDAAVIQFKVEESFTIDRTRSHHASAAFDADCASPHAVAPPLFPSPLDLRDLILRNAIGINRTRR